MEKVLEIANGPALWLFSAMIVSIVVVQATLFLRMTLAYSEKYQILNPQEKIAIYKMATINSVGPAIAIFFVAVSLIAMVGAPITLARVGVIGSVIFEFFAANEGAKAAGVKLGSVDYGLVAFTASVWIMTLGGMGWLVGALILTKQLDKAQTAMSVGNPEIIKALGGVTPIAIMFVLGLSAAIKKLSQLQYQFIWDDMAAFVTGIVAMIIFLKLGKLNPWIRDWGMGFAIILGITAAYFVKSIM